MITSSFGFGKGAISGVFILRPAVRLSLEILFVDLALSKLFAGFMAFGFNEPEDDCFDALCELLGRLPAAGAGGVEGGAGDCRG